MIVDLTNEACGALLDRVKAGSAGVVLDGDRVYSIALPDGAMRQYFVTADQRGTLLAAGIRDRGAASQR